jgi:protoporphyrinogen oxidase
MPNVGVVGGGLLGLTLALRLRQRGYEVTVFEAAPVAGGLAAPATIGSYSWDRFPHDILLSDRHLRSLLLEIGIIERLRWGRARTGLLVGGRVHSLSSPLDLLRYPQVGLIDKARLGLTIIRAGNLHDPAVLEALGAAEWLARWSGTQAYERVWLPLLRARLGENHTKASAAFAWNLVARMYAARRLGHRRELFGYVQGGYGVILHALGEQLAELGVRLEVGVPVARVIDDACGATVLLQDGRSATLDHVVLTTPAPITARLCPQLSDTERARLERVTYQGVMCMSVLLRRSLGGFYATNIADPGMPFTNVIEQTALIPPAMLGGLTLVYLPRQLAQDDVYWSLSDTTIRSRFLEALGTMYPTLAQRDVVALEIARVRYAMALPTRHYTRDALPPLHTSRARIHFVSSAQIAYGTLGANDTIALANNQAARLHLRLAPNDVERHTRRPVLANSAAGRAP